MMELPADAPVVRLCHLTKWEDFVGYGFNLHTDKTKNIQTLGDIDKGSPAEAAGLLKGDRIVEVNGQNVFNENHRQVVERIKTFPNETQLLVVDSVTDQWYRDRNIVINGSLPSVRTLSSSKNMQTAEQESTKMTNGSPPSVESSVVSAPDVGMDSSPSARLCHLRKWPDFDGYGFNLHADRSKGTQFIGVIDPNSPAETAGMKQNDKIIEVNGENVEGLDHRQLVERIKAVPNETTLLVVDESALNYCHEKGIQISSNMKTNLERFETPSANPRNRANSGNNNNKDLPPPMPKTPPPAVMADEEVDLNLVPRKCLLRKWADFDGYGFNLHADKGKNLHYIGVVDEGSPAKLGGLKPEDRLIEVNGLNIRNLSHKDIIERIKSNPSQTELLVVDKDTDRLYHERGITPQGDRAENLCLATPPREALEEHAMMDNDASSKSSTPKMLPSTPSSNRSEELPPPNRSNNLDDYDMSGVNSPSPRLNVVPPEYSDSRNGRTSVDSPVMERDLNSQMANTTINGETRLSTPVSNESSNNSFDHNEAVRDGGDVSPIFSMKASDVREMLRQRKKKDPRVQTMDLMQKYKIMEQL